MLRLVSRPLICRPISRHLMTTAMASKTQKQHEKEVKEWGFKNVLTWTDAPNAYYSPHCHQGLTTHVILRGQMTVTYPQDEKPTKQTFGPGERVDIDAGRDHEVWIGKEGATMVIGERND